MKRGGRVALSLAIVAAGVALVGAAVLPALVARVAVDEAKKRGIELTVGGSSLSMRGVRLSRLTASDPRVPGVVVDLDRLDVLFSMAASFDDATAIVRGFRPAGSRMIVRNMIGSITRAPGETRVGGAMAFTGDLVLFAGERQVAGPWRLVFTRQAGVDRQLVELAPAHPGAATLRREARIDGTSSHVQIAFAKQHLADLGLPSLPFTPPSATVDVDVDHTVTGDTVRGHVKTALSIFSIPRAPSAAPLHTSFSYDGKAAHAPLKDGTFEFGPFHGTVGGFVDAARLPPAANLQLTGAKMPCASLAQSAAEQALPGANAALAALGLDKAAKSLVTGEIGFVGSVDLDPADLAATKVDARPVGSCNIDVPLFPIGVTVTPR